MLRNLELKLTYFFFIIFATDEQVILILIIRFAQWSLWRFGFDYVVALSDSVPLMYNFYTFDNDGKFLGYSWKSTIKNKYFNSAKYFNQINNKFTNDKLEIVMPAEDRFP